MRAPEPTVDDFEDVLAAEGMPAELGAVTWYRKLPQQCESQGLGRTGAGPGAENWRAQCHSNSPYSPADYERAAALLPDLEGDDLKAWAAFCEGATERRIAKTLGRSRHYVWSRHLQPLLVRAGIAFKPRPHSYNPDAPKRNRMDSPENNTKASRKIPVRICFETPVQIEGSSKTFIEGELDKQTAMLEFEIRGARCRISEHSRAILYVKYLKKPE